MRASRTALQTLLVSVSNFFLDCCTGAACSGEVIEAVFKLEVQGMTFRAKLLTTQPSLTGLNQSSIEFQLHNDGPMSVVVLKWYTPLEGLWSDCLRVTHNGVNIPYDGPLAKRGAPSAQDFVCIPAGGSFAVCVDVSKAYDTTDPGFYEVAVDTTLEEAITDIGLSAMVRTQEYSLTSPPVTFQVYGGTSPTQGTAARAAELQKNQKDATESESALQSPISPKEPKFEGDSSDMQDIIRTACINGYQLASEAAESFCDEATYREWFGTVSDARLSKVWSNFIHVKLAMEQKVFTYNFKGDGCPPHMYAYTYKGSTTVWICNEFWMADSTGTDSQAGTILHELMHAVVSLDDLAYGQQKCKDLATADPNQAIRNADSHEYFAGG